METIKEIAEGLAIELLEKFGVQFEVIPAMYYDLNDIDKYKNQLEKDPFNAISLRYGKIILSITPDTIELAVMSDSVVKMSGVVSGLEGVQYEAFLDRPKNPELSGIKKKFDINDPKALDTIIEEIDKLRVIITGRRPSGGTVDTSDLKSEGLEP